MGTVSDSAKWLSGPIYVYGKDDAGYYRDHRNHVLSRTFSLGASSQAELSIAVLGYARALVNGQPLGNIELLGDWTNYTKLVYVRTFDVSDLVHEGENHIEVELGNGWYNPSPLTMFGK